MATSYEQLESIFDSLSAVVYVADLDTNEIIFNNRYMADLFGEDLKGRPCYQVIRQRSNMCRKCGADSLVGDRGEALDTVVWEERNPILDRWFMHHSRAIPWRDGRLVRLQISTDITQLKKLEQERLNAAHFEQAQRLRSLGTLAGGVAHEFNNLLMGMMGSLSLIKVDVKESHPFHLNLGRIETNIHEASKLTDKLLGYAQKGRYEKRPFLINPMIRSLIKLLNKTHTAVTFELDLDEKLFQIEADSRQIEHALLSLLTNACEAMPEGGDLKISTANVSAYDRATPNSPEADAYVKITVQDNGVGMTPEIKAQIFDPFFTTKRTGRGAGLGMAAAYGIFKGHGGFIDVDSSLGEGSRLVVHLPASTATGTFAEDEDVDKKDKDSRKKTVLLADDESIILEIGEQMLSHLGHDVLIADSGEAAVAKFQQHHGIVDLIILDVVMPEMSVMETYEKLKTIDPGIKIIISSGFRLDAEVHEKLVMDTDDFLQKPFSMEELTQKVNKAFDIASD